MIKIFCIDNDIYCRPKNKNLIFKKDSKGNIVYTVELFPKQIFKVTMNSTNNQYRVSKNGFSFFITEEEFNQYFISID